MPAIDVVRRRVQLLLQGDYQFAHFANLILWLRSECVGSTLQEVGNFLGHPYRQRGVVSKALADITTYLQENLQPGFDSTEALARMQQMVIPLEDVHFVVRETLIDKNVLLTEDDDKFADIYEPLTLFCLTVLHLTEIQHPDGFIFPLFLSVSKQGYLGITTVYSISAKGHAYRFVAPVFSTPLKASDWLHAKTDDLGIVREPVQYVPSPAIVLL